MTHHYHPSEMSPEELREERNALTNLVHGATAIPSEVDLENAPIIDDWMLFTALGDLSLFGRIVQQNGQARTQVSSALVAIDEDFRWAYLEDGWMRLGPRFMFEPSAPNIVLEAVPTNKKRLMLQLEGQAFWAGKALEALGKLGCDS